MHTTRIDATVAQLPLPASFSTEPTYLGLQFGLSMIVVNSCIVHGPGTQGAEEPYVESADELLAIVDEAKGRRSTHATDVNASSSRSHAVLRITVERTRSEHGVPYSVSQLGRLTLVDCAGRYAAGPLHASAV
jgi:hypothetical protein